MELGIRLRGGGCRPFGSDFAVKVDDRNVYFPDVTVVCQPQRGRFTDEPVLIVEVLSPSSEKDDRGRKWKGYQRLGSLKHYLLLDQQQMEAELWLAKNPGARAPHSWHST